MIVVLVLDNIQYKILEKDGFPSKEIIDDHDKHFGLDEDRFISVNVQGCWYIPKHKTTCQTLLSRENIPDLENEAQ